MCLTLQRGKYPGAKFDDLVTAVVNHNIGLNKSHRIRERRPSRIAVICGAGFEKCAFRVYATSVKYVTGIQIATFAQHSCQDRSQRARQVKSDDVWEARWFSKIWHASTWLRQHAHSIKRAAVKGADLKQTALVPADLTRRPGRKSKRPYEPSEKHPRTCGACGIAGHFTSSCPSPDVKRLADRKQKSAEKAADDAIAILTQRE